MSYKLTGLTIIYKDIQMKTTYVLTLFILTLTSSVSMAAEDESKSTSIGDFGFGAGLSFTMDLGSHDRIKSAEVVDGLVRVTDEENGIPRLVLEGHYFFRDSDFGFNHGPFVAVQPGSDEIINSVAIGYMMGWKKADKTSSWNIGLGVVADPNVQTLGDGVSENKALPGNETVIRYKETTQYGLMLLFSTSW
jgi:hypothetical protein